MKSKNCCLQWSPKLFLSGVQSEKLYFLRNILLKDFTGSPVVKTLCFHCRGYGFHPWLGTKIPYASRHSQKKKKKEMSFPFSVRTLKAVFKIFIDFVTIFHVLVFWPPGLWDLSSSTRGWTCSPCIGRGSLNHWMASQVPVTTLSSSCGSSILL